MPGLIEGQQRGPSGWSRVRGKEVKGVGARPNHEGPYRPYSKAFGFYSRNSQKNDECRRDH